MATPTKQTQHDGDIDILAIDTRLIKGPITWACARRLSREVNLLLSLYNMILYVIEFLWYFDPKEYGSVAYKRVKSCGAPVNFNSELEFVLESADNHTLNRW